MRYISLSVNAAIALTLLAGCTVKDVEPPALAGPSTLATAIYLQAQPDSILQDNSTATITATAMGPDGRPVSVDLRGQIFVDNVAVDFGTLAPKSLRTGSDGVARFIYTAPSRPVESVGTGTRVTISITPVGSDFGSERSRQVSINVIPPGVILPPNGAPVASFSVSPSGLTRGVTATFDASASTDEGVTCGSACTYQWNFGDGSTGSGMVTTHQYRSSGSFSAILTVTDPRAMTGSATQTITVAAAALPTAAFLFSPSSPAKGQTIFFN
ncbi:MAG: PKD domain-containing protein, partial [Vicinamibacterales bacterium]